MSATLPTAVGRATIEDLERTPEKAELINGRIVRFMATGYRPNLVAGRIFRKLADYVDASGRGHAFTDNIAFAVGRLSSGRQSFAPDAAYYDGAPPPNPMKFIAGTPTFAVEVRSENDYGPAEEIAMAEKRADYFEAGTPIVWDVDPIADTILAYRIDDPETPTLFRRGDIATAEPAVPGWQLDTAWLFA